MSLRQCVGLASSVSPDIQPHKTQQMEMSIEFKSDDGTVGPDHVMALWSRTFIEAGKRMGKTFKIANDAVRLIREAASVDVEERWYKK